MPKTSLHRLMVLFEGCASAHGTHGEPDRDPGGLKWTIRRTARTLREPVTEELWSDHVAGKKPLGVIPIREDSTCTWGSIDFDVYDVDLLEIVQRVEQAKLPLMPCVSKSGGLHLFLFLDAPVSAVEVQTLLRDAAASLGMADCEIFPKQQQVLTKHNDLGNWMVMPYFGGTFGGKLREQRGLKKTGAEMTLDEFVKAAENTRTSAQKMAELCETRRGPSPSRRNGSGKKSTGTGDSPGDFTDGPPCLQHISGAGSLSDGRKRFLFMAALYFKRADPKNWRARVEKLNQDRCRPPLPSGEVTATIKSVGKKEYEYTCKDEPMRSHCDSALCRTRRHGVGRGGEYPVISGMSKLETQPPIWFVDVEGARLALTTDELQTYMKFHRACMERVNKSFKMIRQDAWLAILGEALTNVVPLDPPVGAEPGAEFKSLLTRFLTNRGKARRREEIVSNKPFEEEKKFWFLIDGLRDFLKKEKFVMSDGMLYDSIRRLGGGDRDDPGGKRFNIGGKFFSPWWVPVEAIETLPEIKPEKIEDKENF